jgi:hypothetical protein
MNWSRAIPVGLLFWAIAAPSQAGANPRNLCFFSLNNSNEFELTRAFLEDTNPLGNTPVQAIEFHHPARDANPESSFRSMLENPQACDGLVISGHHTGSFSGNRAKGVLNIDFLERLSCDPKYPAFFEQVKAVWLQGCRTLGAGPITRENENGEELQADYHMQRVGAELIYNGLEQSFSELSYEFSTTLDQDNPLATRYMRVFPAANVFGWTRTSPGVKAKSEKSLLYHMAHMTHISQEVAVFNPLRQQSPALKANMSASLWQVLGGDSSYGSLAREAWLSHGRVKTSGLGFDNPDLQAYSPLLHSSQDSLLSAKSLGCDLRNAGSQDEFETALSSILLNQQYVDYNLNVLREVFQSYRRENSGQYAALRQQLVSSHSLMSLLNRKLKSPQTGLLMKIEYYSFYKELTGDSVREVEAIIREHVRYFLLAQDLAGSSYDIRDFREALLLSLDRHQLAETSFYRQVIRAPEVQSPTLYALSWSFLKHSPPQAELLISDIVSHPAVENDSLRVAAIWILNNGTSEEFAILETIVAHPQVDEATLGTVSAVLVNYKLKGNAELVKAIVAHPKAGTVALSQLSLAIQKQGIDVDNDLLEDILSHPAIDRGGLQNIARVIGDNRELGSSELLLEIVNHREVDAFALTSVVIALKDDRFEEESGLLLTIQYHPRADARTLGYVDRALARRRPPEPEQEFY